MGGLRIALKCPYCSKVNIIYHTTRGTTPPQTRDTRPLSHAAGGARRVLTRKHDVGRNFQTIPREMRSQFAVSALMAYATYITVVCPCRKTLSCHLNEFFGAVGAASLLVVYENYVPKSRALWREARGPSEARSAGASDGPRRASMPPCCSRGALLQVLADGAQRARLVGVEPSRSPADEVGRRAEQRARRQSGFPALATVPRAAAPRGLFSTEWLGP